MILTGTREQSERDPQHFALQEGSSTKNVYFASPPDQRPSPNAFLIKQSPHSVLKAHFHHASQFQVVVQGGGKIGRHDISPLTVHYSGQQTSYGPLVAGAEGLWYLTLRAVTESGAWFMPEAAKAGNREIPRKYHLTDSIPPTPVNQLATKGGMVVRDLLAGENGLGSWIMSLPPDTALPAPPAFIGCGRYYIVTAGSLVSADRELTQLSLFWLSDEERIDMKSGARGAEVLIVQFPVDAWKFEERPSAEPAMKVSNVA